MKRIEAREIAVQLGFAAAFRGVEPEELLEAFFSPEHYPTLAEEDGLFSRAPGPEDLKFIRRLTGLMAEKRPEIDKLIQKYARGWRPERISRTALAVLRCALCELLYMNEDNVTVATAINAAVELDKKYDTPETVAFVNGVLGSIVREELQGRKRE